MYWTRVRSGQVSQWCMSLKESSQTILQRSLLVCCVVLCCVVLCCVVLQSITPKPSHRGLKTFPNMSLCCNISRCIPSPLSCKVPRVCFDNTPTPGRNVASRGGVAIHPRLYCNELLHSCITYTFELIICTGVLQ